MKKIKCPSVYTLILFALFFGVGVNVWAIDQKTKNKIKVKFINAETLYEDEKYNEALEKLYEIEGLLGRVRLATGQNLKVKTLLELGKVKEAKKALEVLYGLNPSDTILQDIASYEDDIEEKLAEQRAREEAEHQRLIMEQKKKEAQQKKKQDSLREKERSLAAIKKPLIESREKGASAEIVWEKIDSFGKQKQPQQIIRDHDSGYLLRGLAGEERKLWVKKVDSQWNDVWEFIEEDPNIYATDITVSDDGYILAGGSISGYGHQTLTKIDKNGGKLWSRIYKKKGHFTKAVENNDGSIMAVGRTLRYLGPNEDDYYPFIEVCNFKSNGAYIKRKYRKSCAGQNFDHPGEINDLVIGPNDEKYLVGDRSRPSYGFMLSINTSLDVNWMNPLNKRVTQKGNYRNYTYTNLMGVSYDGKNGLMAIGYGPTHNRDKIFGGGKSLSSDQLIGGGWTDLILIKTNLSGKVLWAKAYGEEFFDEGSYIETDQMGGAILVGRLKLTQDDARSWIVKVDNDGKQEWDRVLSKDTRVYGGFSEPDGSYIFYGMKEGSNWVMKLNSPATD